MSTFRDKSEKNKFTPEPEIPDLKKDELKGKRNNNKRKKDLNRKDRELDSWN
jgi:hypothetical protein